MQLLGRAQLPFEAARNRVALAETLRALGREEAARQELALARERLAALGAVSEERRAAAIQAGHPLAERPPLSARESEVLRLVAQGLSNRQIAERLILSEHTVHRHVANEVVRGWRDCADNAPRSSPPPA